MVVHRGFSTFLPIVLLILCLVMKIIMESHESVGIFKLLHPFKQSDVISSIFLIKFADSVVMFLIEKSLLRYAFTIILLF